MQQVLEATRPHIEQDPVMQLKHTAQQPATEQQLVAPGMPGYKPATPEMLDAMESQPPVDPWAPATTESPYARIYAAAELLRTATERREAARIAEQTAHMPQVPYIPGRPDAVDPVRIATPQAAVESVAARVTVVPGHRQPQHDIQHVVTEQPVAMPVDEQSVIEALSRTLTDHSRELEGGDPQLRQAKALLHELRIPSPGRNSRRYEAFQQLHRQRLHEAIGLLAVMPS